MKHYLFVPLGVSETPLGLNRKSEPFSLGAAALLGGSSLLGGILGLSSQKSANEMNLQMNRETNQMNYQIAKEANDLSQAQFIQNMNWLKEQYYDTDQYSRLVQSLHKAGLNPALALGNVSPVGSVGSPSSSNFHAAQMEAGHVDPLSYDALSDGFSSAVNAYYDNQLKSEQSANIGADTKTKWINNQTQGIENLMRLHDMWEDIQNKRSQRGLTDAQRNHYDKLAERLQQEIDFAARTTDLEYSGIEKRNRQLDDLHEESLLRQESQRIANKYAVPLNEATVREILSSMRNNDAQAARHYAEKAVAEAQEAGFKLDNELKDNIMDDLIDEARQNADKRYYEAQDAAKIYHFGYQPGRNIPAQNLDGSTTIHNRRGDARRKKRKVKDKNGKVIINHY